MARRKADQRLVLSTHMTLGGQHGPNTVKTFVAQTADQWRKWLDEHHDSESEVWLIFHKVHTGVGSIAYLDALDEALCFGWVDRFE